MAGIDAEVHHRGVRVEVGESTLGEGGDAGAVVDGAQRPGPGVEELDGTSSTAQLGGQECGVQVGHPLHEPGPGLRIRVHHRAGGQVVTRGPALHQVGGNRERGAGETNQWRGVTEFFRHQAGSLFDGRGIAGLALGDPVDVVLGANRLVENWSDSRLDPHPDLGHGQRHHDVGVEDGPIDMVTSHRLAGDLSCQLRVEAGVEHRRALAGLAVLRERTARLTHEPNRGDGRAMPGHGLQKR